MEKIQFSRTVNHDNKPEREVVGFPKKTNRTFHKTATDFNESRQAIIIMINLNIFLW